MSALLWQLQGSTDLCRPKSWPPCGVARQAQRSHLLAFRAALPGLTRRQSSACWSRRVPQQRAPLLQLLLLLRQLLALEQLMRPQLADPALCHDLPGGSCPRDGRAADTPFGNACWKAHCTHSI